MQSTSARTAYLLDVSYFTFRAYHALPPLTTADGRPTNAVHGVATMLERLIREEQPKYMAACFDAAGPGFRNEIYPQYKANRAEPDQDLRVQFPYIRRLIEAMSIRCVEQQGYEADDLLASLASTLRAEGYDVVIVTGDKDLMQCVGEHVTLYDPVRERRVGVPEVKEKFGVAPSAVADLQGLMGDRTDNIPGVRGVGPKTASVLIGHFGSLENLLAHAEEVEGLELRGAAALRQKIEQGAEAARVSKDLATIRSDLPLGLTGDDLAFETPHTPELLALADDLEMRSFAVRLRKLLGEVEVVQEQGSGDEARSRPMAVESSKIAAASEFAGDWRLIAPGEALFLLNEERDTGPLLVLCQGTHRIVVSGDDEAAAAISTLAARGVSFSGYNVKDLCRRFGCEPGDAALDVGVASYLYDASVGEHDDASVVARFLREDLVGPSPMEERLVAALDQLQRTVAALRRALAEHGQEDLYRRMELPLIGVLARIEARGVLLDCDLLSRLGREYGERMKALVNRIYESAGGPFNILSPVQLREVLFGRLGLPSKGVRQTKTGSSTDSETLHVLARRHPLPGLILEYRMLAKLKSTYLDVLPGLADARGRVHTRLNQTVTATGRLSSADPNLQNIPIRTDDGAGIRRAFVAPPGWRLLSADYNQIELRVLAHLSGDSTLTQAFEQGMDVHAATASELFGVATTEVTPEMRRASKVINYGIIYGMGAGRMSRELAIPRAEAAAYIERYFERYPGVRAFYADMLAQARLQGYVTTIAGRRRYLPDINSGNGGLRQAAERIAGNTPIQGSAADIIKLAMVELSVRLVSEGLESAMVLQIHDELLLECPAGEVERVTALTRSAMEGAMVLTVPVVVDVGVGSNWAEAH